MAAGGVPVRGTRGGRRARSAWPGAKEEEEQSKGISSSAHKMQRDEKGAN